MHDNDAVLLDRRRPTQMAIKDDHCLNGPGCTPRVGNNESEPGLTLAERDATRCSDDTYTCAAAVIMPQETCLIIKCTGIVTFQVKFCGESAITSRLAPKVNCGGRRDEAGEVCSDDATS